MKKILITGANSYIGTSFEKWVMDPRFDGKYWVDTVDMRGEEWRKRDFSQYDVVFHVAGIAHQKETMKNIEQYYKVNRDLAIETALKAKTEWVKQFVFLSSMSVYGIKEGGINSQTMEAPKSNYGKSKLEAETEILRMATDDFRIAILRPPMVYGHGCKGNYKRLSHYAKKLPVFPDIHNKRSMIYIENLCMFVQSIIDNGKSGLYCPQDPEYVCTSKMVRDIADMTGHRIIMIPLWDGVSKIFPISIIKKVFGSLYYENFDVCKQFYTYNQSLIRTEKIGRQGESQKNE
ncbi:NAD-dependent epimerase/dehydratase family protein [[Clostridium] symbiosum]|uniref:NAD-dependent epimerase/dehydratase family protein n=1 Tax=Clostridium symbiosum TaxID=1512 RepID=UPI001D0656FE|nr:NAD-dependent epimerase/dehydratase family protein [[Clostridium] symbiosum]MCB6608395.1 NAD-dependent epimerase/dehydratase family protein [[Clostridium] symbiosum]MCB6930609.1 NAD-dependent epimerase/dehydratase family protein [[Clostridium] symbiosum]